MKIYYYILLILVLGTTACTSDKPNPEEQETTQDSVKQAPARYVAMMGSDTAFYTDTVLFRANTDTANVETEDVTKIILAFPIIDSFKRSEVKKEINQTIQKLLLLDQAGDIAFKSLDARMTDFISDYREEQADMEDFDMGFSMKWTCEVDIEILFNSPQVLSMRVFESNFTGGAHANTWTRLLNFDMQTGERLALEDFFEENYRDKLLIIAEDFFKEAVELPNNTDLTATDFEFEGGYFELPKHFAITRKGILFLFNPYEVGPFAMGRLEFLVPYGQIYHLMNQRQLNLKKI